VAGPPDDDDGDYAISMTPYPKVANPTIELNTSDLANMEQSGVAQAKPNLVIQLDGGRTVELEPGWSQKHDDRKVVVDDVASVIVETEPRAPVTPAAVAASRELAPRAAPQRSGAWLVVAMYVLALTALGLAIYERFMR
jgi:hypothetical protein